MEVCEPAVVLLTPMTLLAVALACGSTIVNTPPVRLMPEFNWFKANKAAPLATEFAATPPAFPSIFISPPLWLKKEEAPLEILPYIFSVPLETVRVPLFVKVLLQNVLSAIPTFTMPPSTVNVPLVLLVTPVAAAPVMFNVPADAFIVPLLLMLVTARLPVPLTVRVEPVFEI